MIKSIFNQAAGLEIFNFSPIEKLSKSSGINLASQIAFLFCIWAK